MPVMWRPLKGDEIDLLKNGMGSTLLKETDVPNPIDEHLELATPGSKEEQLFQCFQLINNKLDFIIDQLASQPRGEGTRESDIIEISASGLKFNTRETLNIGTFLRMQIIMPETFQYQIKFIAEVLRVEEQNDLPVIAAKIIEIDEDGRDAIIKVVFEMQRRVIRNKNND